jgi:hypothetical protein
MSSLSLNRLCNGGGESASRNFNWKFGKSSTLPSKKHVPRLSIDVNNNAPPVPMARRKLLNRRGSLHHNQFKGVRKELIEKHASQIVHTMTVGLRRIDFLLVKMSRISRNFSRFISLNRSRSFTKRFSLKSSTMSAVMNRNVIPNRSTTS